MVLDPPNAPGEAVAVARARLDAVAETVAMMDRVQREIVAGLLALWPTSGWLAAGVRSAAQWLHTHAGASPAEARRLERITRWCALDARLATAVAQGTFPLGWADAWGRVVTPERAPFVTDELVSSVLSLPGQGLDDDQHGDVVRYWRDRIDEQLTPRRHHRHNLTASPSLFGGGEVHANLAPVAFETVLTAIDAFTQEPDAADAPYRRTFAERRADALDDLAMFALTHDTGQHGSDHAPSKDPDVDDTFDGMIDGEFEHDGLDDLLAGTDPATALRDRIRARVTAQRRRTCRQPRPRSGARVTVHIDLATLAGTRELHDLAGITHRGDRWPLARDAAEQLLCDSSLVATLFRGRRLLDANADAERFTGRQRRAIAARDRHCVFPGCRRPPDHCDVHHLHEVADGGPSIVDNGVLLCRFHHRLVHQGGWTLTQTRCTVADGEVPSTRWVAIDRHGQHWHEHEHGHHEHRHRQPDPPPVAALR